MLELKLRSQLTEAFPEMDSHSREIIESYYDWTDQPMWLLNYLNREVIYPKRMIHLNDARYGTLYTYTDKLYSMTHSFFLILTLPENEQDKLIQIAKRLSALYFIHASFHALSMRCRIDPLTTEINDLLLTYRKHNSLRRNSPHISPKVHESSEEIMEEHLFQIEESPEGKRIFPIWPNKENFTHENLLQ